MKKLMSSMMVAALAAGSLVTLPACTDGEIIASSVIIGAAVIANDDHDYDRHHHYRPRPSRPSRPRAGIDRPYYPANPVKPGHGRVSPPRRTFALIEAQETVVEESTAQNTSDFVSTDTRVINTAQKYEISHYAATYVVRAILLAQSKDLSGVKDLGLEKSDMKRIYEGKALSEEKIEAMSAKLLMSSEDTAVLLENIAADVQAEKTARN